MKTLFWGNLKMKKATAVLLVLLACASLLAACGGTGDVLKGTWEGTDADDFDVKLVFDGKGGVKMTSGFMSNAPGTYTITGDQLELKMEMWGGDAQTFTFVIADKSLPLTEPEGVMYGGYDLTKK
jgi:hypothetical protein